MDIMNAVNKGRFGMVWEKSLSRVGLREHPGKQKGDKRWWDGKEMTD